MLPLRITILFIILLFTNNIRAQSYASFSCELDRDGLTYDPKLKELISCHGWNVWKRFKVSLKPEKFISKKVAFTEGPIYKNRARNSEIWYYIEQPVLTSTGLIIPLGHMEDEPGHILSFIDTRTPQHTVFWSRGCIGDSLSNCIFTVSSQDLKYLSQWVTRKPKTKISPTLSLRRWEDRAAN